MVSETPKTGATGATEATPTMPTTGNNGGATLEQTGVGESSPVWVHGDEMVGGVTERIPVIAHANTN